MSHYFFYKKIVFIFFINFYIINFCSQTVNDNSKSISSHVKGSSPISDCNLDFKTLFLPLSVGQNLYTQYHKEKYQKFDISLTYRFQQAYNNNDIAISLFNTNPLLFVGLVNENFDDTGRPKNALIPDYFGLSSDTNISCSLSPQIRNQILDLQLSFQGDNFWTQVNIPLVKAQWKINHLPLVNNRMVGKTPLQPYAEVYIYNIGQKLNDYPAALPPTGNEAQAKVYNYNILPIITPPATINPPNYTGAYIISPYDASEDNTFTGASYFNSKDENVGSINFGNSIYNENFIGNNELTADNWKLDIGTWPDVSYDLMAYQAASEPVPPKTDPNPASLDLVDNCVLTGSVEDISSINSNVNTIRIIQNQLSEANTLIEALSGEYDFNQSMKRLYNNFNFNKNFSTQIWGVADIIVWVGYDFCRDVKKHIGLYMHGVIPSGTNINEEWYQYSLNPVVGNGNHYQLGLGITGSYLFCNRNTFSLTCNIDGYIDHVFSTNQFRVFDKLNNPMSRYAVVKKLLCTGASQDNIFNDDYEYVGLDILGNINNANLMISNNFKGEFIIDLIMKNNYFEGGFGYAFSGISADVINCDGIPMYNDSSLSLQNQTYYGYKGNTGITNIIVMNITSGQEVFDPAANANPPLLGLCPNNPPAPAPQIACNYPVAALFPTTAGVVTPNPNNILIKSCGDVTIGGNSGAYLYGESAGGNNDGADYVGTSTQDIFILPNITDNNSGLMDSQILNKIFAHVQYNWETIYAPTVGLVGSYGFGTKNYFTALYWDVGCYLSCSF